MLGDPRVEAVRDEVALAREQSEGGARHDPVQVPLAGADRTVALGHLARGALNLVAHAAAVAAARRDHRHRGMLETAIGGVNAGYNHPRGRDAASSDHRARGRLRGAPGGSVAVARRTAGAVARRAQLPHVPAPALPGCYRRVGAPGHRLSDAQLPAALPWRRLSA